MTERIIVHEGEWWKVRTASGSIPESERRELIEYFSEIRYPFSRRGVMLRISDRPGRESLLEVLGHFYDGRAEVILSDKD